MMVCTKKSADRVCYSKVGMVVLLALVGAALASGIQQKDTETAEKPAGASMASADSSRAGLRVPNFDGYRVIDCRGSSDDWVITNSIVSCFVIAAEDPHRKRSDCDIRFTCIDQYGDAQGDSLELRATGHEYTGTLCCDIRAAKVKAECERGGGQTPKSRWWWRRKK